MKYRLTLLEQMRVVRDDGKDLGRLMDMRARAGDGPVLRSDSFPIDALLVGAAGWFERMGLTRGSGREVAAASVIAVEQARIIVRGGASKSSHRRGTKGKRK